MITRKFATWIATHSDNFTTPGTEYEVVKVEVESYGTRYEFIDGTGSVNGAAAKCFGPIREEQSFPWRRRFAFWLINTFPSLELAMLEEVRDQEKLAETFRAELREETTGDDALTIELAHAKQEIVSKDAVIKYWKDLAIHRGIRIEALTLHALRRKPKTLSSNSKKAA